MHSAYMYVHHYVRKLKDKHVFLWFYDTLYFLGGLYSINSNVHIYGVITLNSLY